MRNIIITILSAIIIGAQAYGQVEYVVTGAANAFSLNYPANVTALTPGLSFTFKSNQSITGPATLAVNGLAAVSIKKEVSQNLIANDILNNQIVTVVYDGTNFQMTSKAGTSGGGGADSHIQDLGGNTFIETDAIGDGTGDVIDFNLGGTQHFQMDGARLEVLNSGGNVLIGEGAGVATSTGTNNVSMGTSSGTANTTGFGNVNVGYETDMTRITTNGNTSVGYQAGRSGTTGNYSTMVGFQAGMNSSSERSTLIGYQAGLNNTGNYTVAIGYGAGSNNTFFDPVYIGRFAGYNNTSGQNNVAIGAYSLNANITSGYNVAVGYGTLRNNTASWNTAVGNNALNSNVTGTENAAFGTDALIDNTSSNNSAFGSQALRSTTSGQRNTSSGYYSLRGNTIGNYNTALGAYAGDLNTTGSSNTLIGYQADVAANNLTNATAIGANSSVGQSNSLILGGTGASAVNVGIGTTTPAATLDITGTDAIVLPQGNTGQRPGTPEQGMLRFNADLTTFEGYDGTVWTDLAAGGAGGDFFADGSVSMTGTFKAIGGSSAFPSMTFDTDQNTGIYSGVADNLSFTTAGTQRVLIDNAGQVAIGGTSPVALLDVDGDVRIDYNSVNQTSTSIFNSNSGFTSSLGGTKGLMVGVTTSGSEQLVGGEFRTGGASSGPQVALNVSADGNSTGVYNRGLVATAQNNANSNYAIDAFVNGNSGTNYGMRINTGGTHAADKYGVYINSSGSGTRYGVYAQGEDINYFNGDVGIGNNLPNAKLDLNGDLLLEGMAAAPSISAASEGKIYFDLGTGKFKVSENGGAFVDLVSASGGDFFADGTVPMTGNFQLSTNYISNDGDSEGISVSTTGQVNVTPATTGAGNTAFLSNGDIRTVGQGTGVYFTNTAIGITGNNSNLGGMHLYTGSLERVTVNASGDVGIGNSSPASSKLEVNGDMSIMGDSFRFKRGGSGGDMVPVAYGVINDGVKQVNASEGDFTVAKIAAGHYRVSFTGARTFTGFGEFAVMLTVVDQTGGASPLLASYDYFAPQTFDIYLNDLAPTPTDGIVSFELRVK